MNLARIHSTENKFVVIILCSVQNVFTALSRQKSIFGFFVSLGAKYPSDLRSMIQFWIFPKKRTLTSLRVSMLELSFKNFPPITLFELIEAANFIPWLWPESFKPLVICV